MDHAGGHIEERPWEEPSGNQMANEESAARQPSGERKLEMRYLQVRHIANVIAQEPASIRSNPLKLTPS